MKISAGHEDKRFTLLFFYLASTEMIDGIKYSSDLVIEINGGD